MGSSVYPRAALRGGVPGRFLGDTLGGARYRYRNEWKRTMKRLILAAILSAVPALTLAQTNPWAGNKALQYQEKIFPLVESSSVLGTAVGCRQISSAFYDQASASLVIKSMEAAQAVWGGTPTSMPAVARAAWSASLTQLEAAYRTSEASADYAACQNFDANGGPQAIRSAFPGISN